MIKGPLLTEVKAALGALELDAFQFRHTATYDPTRTYACTAYNDKTTTRKGIRNRIKMACMRRALTGDEQARCDAALEALAKERGINYESFSVAGRWAYIYFSKEADVSM